MKEEDDYAVTLLTVLVYLCYLTMSVIRPLFPSNTFLSFFLCFILLYSVVKWEPHRGVSVMHSVMICKFHYNIFAHYYMVEINKNNVLSRL